MNVYSTDKPAKITCVNLDYNVRSSGESTNKPTSSKVTTLILH
jgi:hypothetical protein